MYNIQKLKDDFISMDIFEKLVVVSAALMVVNVYVYTVFMVLILIYSIVKKDLRTCIQNQPYYKLIYGFAFLEVLVCIFNKNLWGFGNTIGIFLMFGFAAVYRQHLSKKCLDFILEATILFSIITCIIGLFQFNHVSKLGGYSFFDFEIQNSPKKRITGGCGNANYYAMLLEFTIVCCMFRFSQVKKVGHKLWYVAIGLLNLFLLYLTGCRAALMPFVIVVPLFLFMSKERGWGIASVVCIVALMIAIYFYPNLIPRVSDTSTVNSRLEIWKCAWLGIKEHPLLGQGPLTYKITYPRFNGHKAPHAHNIYIDAILSFGVIGASILCMIVYTFFKETLKMKKWKSHPEYFAMAISFILILFIHGIMDCTINLPSTGMYLLMVLYMGKLSKEQLFEYSINDCLK